MTFTVGYAVHGSIAVLTLDHPPVNGLGHSLRVGIAAALDRALANPAIRALVLTGGERIFSAGADVREFGTANSSRDPILPSVIRAIEMSSKPVVAAIAGTCLGGGLELALGCHFRVAGSEATLGLPEVKLGLLPGAGGTQRLPRLVGLERALDMILSGAPQAARSFEGTPLIDALIDGELMPGALAFAEKVIAQAMPISRVRDRVVDAPAAEPFLQFARNTVRAASKNMPAPQKCVEALAASVGKPFDEALKLEREFFFQLMNTPESRGLRHAFAAERASTKVAGVPDGTAARPIRQVAVIGAGTMGTGIAITLANAGIAVSLLETGQEALQRGIDSIRRTYESALKKGRLTPDALEQRMNLIAPTLSYDALVDADLAIEAVSESLEVKRVVFEQLDRVLRPGAILASNTSALNLDTIASFTSRPQDVVGLHFFSPAHVMRLLEVVRGAATSAEVLATVMQLARRIGKVAVVAGVCDGFIGNRILARYVSAANDLLLQGASPQQVDRALEEFGLAMGPFRVGDLAGLDISWAVRKRRAAENPGVDFSIAADRLCEAGRFGQKNGAGWYRYEPGRRDPIADPAVDALLAEYRRDKGVTPRAVGKAEIVERCLFAMANEGARILDEGIAQRASDIDVVYLNGYGFPRHRGGPMHYAEEVGLSEVVRALRRIAAEPGADARAWTPAPLLDRLAAEGRGLKDHLEGARK
ncbi:3-hydroxyacyl-CoA dehydrogenase NAD-binding domain-containing protein [Ramlibacter tataouinensis]|uniref:3-hydroxyacyl-CoA dehydrogenase NAD-binding domain-containing protein n=1 Tax=Ramlibacter tataouinensis TaxID=94132 RepID=UPI0022F3B942|nr:3-hydroxyacyl-CoA dehydrogenase NAD-binding domain-containing protein [Ramlibacter tataouinensis]WBY01331.1 3-hydroxyacyl-CoA dehydrogenase NAD-binding domain-containing protein [Ramlibacter tataouinensis]